MIYDPALSSIAGKSLDSRRFTSSSPILVVDDDNFLRELTVRLLHHAGYRTVDAENGSVAKSLIESTQPMLIISDLRMPKCDGWELLKHVHQTHPEIPVVLMSSDVPGHHPEIEQWAAAFMPKPFGPEEFWKTVGKLLPKAA